MRDHDVEAVARVVVSGANDDPVRGCSHGGSSAPIAQVDSLVRQRSIGPAFQSTIHSEAWVVFHASIGLACIPDREGPSARDRPASNARLIER